MAMNKIHRLTLILLLFAAFFYSAFQLFVIWLDYQENEKFHADTRAEFVTIAVSPSEEEPPYDEAHWYMDIDIGLERLKAVNKEIVGWLMVPDSKISIHWSEGAITRNTLPGPQTILTAPWVASSWIIATKQTSPTVTQSYTATIRTPERCLDRSTSFVIRNIWIPIRNFSS